MTERLSSFKHKMHIFALNGECIYNLTKQSWYNFEVNNCENRHCITYMHARYSC